MRALAFAFLIFCILAQEQNDQATDEVETYIDHKSLGSTYFYRGRIQMQSQNYDDRKNMTMAFAVVQNKDITCRYEVCFFGWICNYTSQGKASVEGFPFGKMEVMPVFMFQANSESDFVVTRSADLTKIVATGLDLFVREFNPTTHKDSSYELKDTNDDSELQSGFKENTVKLAGVQTADSSQRRNFTFNKRTGMAEKKNDNVNAALDQQHLKNDQNQTTGFDKHCRIKILKIGNEETNFTSLEKLQAIIKDLKKNHARTCLWNKWRIEHVHESKAKRQVSTKPEITSNEGNESKSVVEGRHLQQFIKDDDFQSFQRSIRLLEEDTTDGDAAAPNPNVRLIFNYSKELFRKKCVGKDIYITGWIQVWIDKQLLSMRIIIQMMYCLFGGNSSIVLYDNTFMPGVGLTFFKRYGGTWGMDFRFPLIPPLAGVYITMGMYITFFFDVTVHVGASMTRDTIAFNGLVAASTGFILEVTAALQVLFIEVGIYIEGTLVNLTLSLDLQLNLFKSTNRITFTTTVTLELRIFSFTWGFFWRFWFFRWSDRMILVSWPITNGIGWKWILFQKQWEGPLHKEKFTKAGKKIKRFFHHKSQEDSASKTETSKTENSKTEKSKQEAEASSSEHPKKKNQKSSEPTASDAN